MKTIKIYSGWHNSSSEYNNEQELKVLIHAIQIQVTDNNKKVVLVSKEQLLNVDILIHVYNSIIKLSKIRLYK